MVADQPGFSRTITDPITRETYTFVETAAENGDDRLVMEIVFEPGGFVLPHAHRSEEQFACLEGRLEFTIDGTTTVLEPGKTITARPHQIHGFRNLAAGPARVRVVATDGARVEFGLRTKVALANAGLFADDGRPKDLLTGALILRGSGLYLAPMPAWIYWPLIASLANMGRWTGREQALLTHFPEYDRLRAAARRA